MSTRIALATCEALPDLDPDDQPLVEHFHEAGIEAIPAVWSDRGIEWSEFDFVILRNTWDYTSRLEEFLDWAQARGDSLRNSYDVVQWNSNKIYLRDLASSGFPIVDTQFVTGESNNWEVPSDSDFVVKPTVSAGSQDTMRYSATDPVSIRSAQDLVDRIVSQGKTAMVQPYLATVDQIGETAQLYIGGEYSHSIRKGPLLVRDSESEKELGLFLKEDITARVPNGQQRELADRLMAYVTGRFGTPLYARVDLLDDMDGTPVILELELVEPSMFFATAPDSALRMVNKLNRM